MGFIIKDKDDMAAYLVDAQICTDDELKLVCCINGYSEQTMKDILYARTGYRDFGQLEDVEGEDEEAEDE